MARSAKKVSGVDPEWPRVAEGDHAVSEFTSDMQGGLSPFGESTFPVPKGTLPYQHPVTVINRPGRSAAGH